MDVVKKVALVTGAGTGIGKSAALALLREGHLVALAGRRVELLQETVAEAGGRRASHLFGHEPERHCWWLLALRDQTLAKEERQRSWTR